MFNFERSRVGKQCSFCSFIRVLNNMLSPFCKMSLKFNTRNQRRRQIAEAMKQRRKEELAVLVDKIKSEIYRDEEDGVSDVFSLTDCDPVTGAQDCDVIELVFE